MALVFLVPFPGIVNPAVNHWNTGIQKASFTREQR
jgi:hypothetical protein